MITIERASEIVSAVDTTKDDKAKIHLFSHFVEVFDLDGYTTPKALKNFAVMCGFGIVYDVEVDKPNH